MEIFDAGIENALAFLAFPLEHHRKISSDNPIAIFPSPRSALRLITMILIEQSESWMTERRYMTPESLELVL